MTPVSGGTMNMHAPRTCREFSCHKRRLKKGEGFDASEQRTKPDCNGVCAAGKFFVPNVSESMIRWHWCRIKDYYSFDQSLHAQQTKPTELNPQKKLN